ncbi:MAG: DUF983 domain-containing protein [Bacteroidota bacterium]
MSTKRNRFKEITGLKCPNCGEGHLFVPVNQFSDLFEMPKKCSVCEQDFYLEPGFYWGAMYVAYAVSSFICLASFSIAFWVFGWTLTNSCVFFTVMAILFSPYTFRLSRSIWLHGNVKRKKRQVR